MRVQMLIQMQMSVQMSVGLMRMRVPIQLMIELVRSMIVRLFAVAGFEIAALIEMFELSALMKFERAAFLLMKLILLRLFDTMLQTK